MVPEKHHFSFMKYQPTVDESIGHLQTRPQSFSNSLDSIQEIRYPLARPVRGPTSGIQPKIHHGHRLVRRPRPPTL